ncbi:MAG TPA: triose-phosphate isomerase [Gemmatimonadaceae bacterium]|nr:triose-phosphate isomerase [Gemmatimonadaceae bacterium]
MSHLTFAANWKMNHGPAAAADFLSAFLAHYPRQYDRTMIFFPSAVALAAAVREVKHRPDIEVGAQNIHWEDKGAFTGELSASMAREAGASFALVGHSERRHIFGESDEDTARKCVAAQRAGLTPLLCVGEKLDERERGEAEAVVSRQLRAGLAQLQSGGGLLLAYEPVWAIGTGRNATPGDAAAMHRHIRSELRALLGDRGSGAPILYGGSVSVGNVLSLLQAHDVDGVLVGGASLQPGTWSAIARTALPQEEHAPLP